MTTAESVETDSDSSLQGGQRVNCNCKSLYRRH